MKGVMNYGKLVCNVFLGVSVLGSLSACTNPETVLVKDLLPTLNGSVTTSANKDVVVTISAQLNSLAYEIGALNLPIVNPSNFSQQYGSIQIIPVAGSSSSTPSSSGGGLVTITVDLTAITSSVQSSNTALPNGAAVPIAFASTATQLVAIPIGTSGAKVYAATGGGTYLVGVAIPFSGLNGAGKYAPGLALFSDATYGDLTGYAGVFAGTGNMQTGVGIFAEVTELVTPSPTTPSTGTTQPGIVTAQPVIAHLAEEAQVAQIERTEVYQPQSIDESMDESEMVVASQSKEEVQISALTSGTSARKIKRYTSLIPSQHPQHIKNHFLYQLWKLGHEQKPVLKYE